MCSITGVPTTGTSGFGYLLVSGRSRDPSPPAMTTAFTDRLLEVHPLSSHHMRRFSELSTSPGGGGVAAPAKRRAATKLMNRTASRLMTSELIAPARRAHPRIG